MFDVLLKKIIGSKGERDVKRMQPTVQRINELEPEIARLTDDQLAGKTVEFRRQLEQGASLDDLLPAAFAVTREAGKRVLGMRHYDVQLMGGMVLHGGNIAEMRTGEGKTLVATLAVYLNALPAEGVHVITVNDYLARRDAEWMGSLYRFLGLTVGTIQHDMDDAERQKAYGSDVTYGTNNEFGFDYLRDNMKFDTRAYVQRGHHFAVVDEVDSVLIDEARTPLIISGPAEQSTDRYGKIDRVVPKLTRDRDFQVDEKSRNVTFTDNGIERAEKVLREAGLLNAGPDGAANLYDPANIEVLHHLEQAMKAHVLFKRDVNYVVREGQVIIVDEFTGRLMPGRRWSDGLHQAVEAKEGARIERENQTLATITFQNYFRMYDKLSGMTGTADTEAAEFQKIYELDVMVIPTNRDLIRIENPDVVYKTEKEKFEACAEEIVGKHALGQPCLVGTISIEKSEHLSLVLNKVRLHFSRKPERLANVLEFAGVIDEKQWEAVWNDLQQEKRLLEQGDRLREITARHTTLDAARKETFDRLLSVLKKGRVPHVVLNAKYHENEAEIVAQAGRLGAVTIATNMAGRGTDILLGGNPEYLARAAVPAVDTPEHAEALEKFRKQCQSEREQVVKLGGLHIIGTERHESRRIDNQLRGRAGRQGDPGSSRFYLSLEDDLMRIFAGDRTKAMMDRLGVEDGVPISAKMVTRSIERAQKQVEGRNFDIRKHLLEYDDVMNKQRQEIYRLREECLQGQGTREYVMERSEDVLDWVLDTHANRETDPGDWQVDELRQQTFRLFGIDLDACRIDFETVNHDGLRATLWQKIQDTYNLKEVEVGEELMRHYERIILLRLIDEQWKNHLYAMDHLKEGINLRGYGQRNPLTEYKRESYEMFGAMKERIEDRVISTLFRSDLVARKQAEEEAHQRRVAEQQRVFQAASRSAAGAAATAVKTVVNKDKKVGRNDPCPCGSGKKYKRCHG